MLEKKVIVYRSTLCCKITSILYYSKKETHKNTGQKKVILHYSWVKTGMQKSSLHRLFSMKWWQEAIFFVASFCLLLFSFISSSHSIQWRKKKCKWWYRIYSYVMFRLIRFLHKSRKREKNWSKINRWCFSSYLYIFQRNLMFEVAWFKYEYMLDGNQVQTPNHPLV